MLASELVRMVSCISSLLICDRALFVPSVKISPCWSMLAPQTGPKALLRSFVQFPRGAEVAKDGAESKRHEPMRADDTNAAAILGCVVGLVGSKLIGRRLPPQRLPGAPLVLNRCAPLKDVFGGKKRKSAEKLAQPKKKKAEELDLPADQAAAARLELLVGNVLSSEAVEDSDTLWKCSVDVGEGEPRTIGAALRQAYPDGLAGKKVIVLANTKPRNLAGFKSQGMLVCATLDDTTRLVEVDAAPGTRALFNGLPAADPATPNQMNNKKLWPTAQASLSTADKRVVLGDCVLAADRAVASVDVGDGASVG